MFLKQYSTDKIFSCLQAWYRGGQSIKEVADGLHVGKSTLRNWIADFENNSKHFGDKEYQDRLEYSFGDRLSPLSLSSGQLVFFALEKLIALGSRKAHGSNLEGNFFFALQEALASPLKIDGVDIAPMGIFRTILDRGGGETEN
jgi:hypothetical protein